MDTFLKYLLVFCSGGLLCLPAQILICKTKLTPARILTGYVVTGVILGAVGIYGRLVKIFGAGLRVPLTGFGYTLASGVKEAVEKHGLMGCLTGGLTASSAGISAAVIFAALWALLFKSRDKNI